MSLFDCKTRLLFGHFWICFCLCHIPRINRFHSELLSWLEAPRETCWSSVCDSGKQKNQKSPKRSLVFSSQNGTQFQCSSVKPHISMTLTEKIDMIGITATLSMFYKKNQFPEKAQLLLVRLTSLFTKFEPKLFKKIVLIKHTDLTVLY